jgi:hypothetical protein
MSHNPNLKIIGKLLIILGIIFWVIGILLFVGLSGFLGFELWQFSLSYFDLMTPLFFVGVALFFIGKNFSRIFTGPSPSDQPYTTNIPTAPEYSVASIKSSEVFGRTRFIVQKQPEPKDSLCILDPSMQPLFYAKHQHSWKTPYFKGIPLPNREMKTTDVLFEGVDGVLLGEIHEIPPEGVRVIKRWQIFNEKGELKGTVKTKPKFIGNDWILETPDGNVAFTVIGNRKKHDYKITTADSYQQTIAGCAAVDKDSFKVDIMLTSFSPFLILSSVIILELSTLGITVRKYGE